MASSKPSSLTKVATPPRRKRANTPSLQEENKESLWRRAFARNSHFEPEEALDVAHWLRQFHALVMGIVCGLLRLTGFPAISTFFSLSFILPSSYCHKFLGIDEDEVAKLGNLKTEGMFSAFALFLLSWILSYSVVTS